MSNPAKILAPRRGLNTTMAESELVLANGEIFIETDAVTGVKRIKIGDGSTAYSSLPYALSGSYNDLTDKVGAATTASAGLMPALSTATGVYLKGDGTWGAVDNYNAMTTAEAAAGTGTTAEVISPAVLASAFTSRFVELTQVEYEQLDPPDPDVWYFITDADVQNVPVFPYEELTESEWASNA